MDERSGKTDAAQERKKEQKRKKLFSAAFQADFLLLWAVETAAPVEIRTKRGFPQELGKPLRGFPQALMVS